MAARNFSSFFDGFMGGMNMARQAKGMFAADQDAADMEAIAMAKPQASTGFTAEQGEELQRLADSGQYEIGYDESTKAYTVTPKADPTQTGKIAQQGVTDFLGERRAGSMSSSEVENARQKAMAGVVGRRDPREASRMRREVVQAEREEQRFAWDKARVQADDTARAKKAADQEELRAAVGSASGGDGDEDAKATQSYLTKSAPKVVSILVRQGRFDEAKKYQDFIDSQQGQEYAAKWVSGLRALSFGDTAGAAKHFESLYNSQLFNDGLTAKFSPIEGKKDAFRIDLSDANGKVVVSQEGSAQELTSKAALFLDPMKAVKFFADEASNQASAQAITDRQVAMERLRQQGRSTVEDRKDTRQAARLAAKNGVNGAFPASGAKGPTVSQARANAEIDAARKTVASLSPEEISRRTQPKNKYGFPNPEYDQELARQARLAARRKYGTDEAFDGGGSGSPATPARTAAGPADRFKSDKSMSGNRLGAQTAKGFEVFDRTGKLIGYYR